MNEIIASLQDAFKWLIISFLNMYNEDLARGMFHDLNSLEVNGELLEHAVGFLRVRRIELIG